MHGLRIYYIILYSMCNKVLVRANLRRYTNTWIIVQTMYVLGISVFHYLWTSDILLRDSSYGGGGVVVVVVE